MSNSATNARFLEACQAGELLLQHCKRCQHVQFYPRVVCAQCASAELDWQPAKGGGTVASYTVIRQAISSEFKDLVPYVAALIDLEEGPRMMSVIVDTDLNAVSVGMKVSLDFAPWGNVESQAVFRINTQ